MKLGENKLTVTAVDKNGNTNTLEKTIIISSKRIYTVFMGTLTSINYWTESIKSSMQMK